MHGLVCARSKACCDKTGVTWTCLCTVLCCDFRVLSHSLLNGTTSIGKVCQCVGVTREVMSPVVCNLAILRDVVPRRKGCVKL